MTTGCIWGWWDKWHAGTQAALEQACQVCDGDDLHIVIINGTDRDTGKEAGFDTFESRINDVKDRVKDIKDVHGWNPKATYHEYATLDDAVADGHTYTFDRIFVVAHDQIKECYQDQVDLLNANRSGTGQAAVVIETVPTINETGSDQVLSATKTRVRANMGS